jgi:hypothetical protein
MDANKAKKLITAKSALKKPTRVKVQSAPKTSKVPPSKKHVFNAETAQVLRDAEAGKNMTTYVDEDDLFRKLGIKIGTAKA